MITVFYEDLRKTNPRNYKVDNENNL